MKYILLLLLAGCSQTSYLYHQGIGQISLEWNGRDNTDVLSDPKVKPEIKDKIKKVQKAKEFFVNYFGLKSNSIYEQTTFLKDKAVTYLVIVSPKNKIKAKRFSFPIMGSFPYLGFFSKEHAKEFAKDQRANNYATHLRPVFAYSTLNKWIFNDNILSSFFYLSDDALEKLIFHELVHTVLFVKNQVRFNENFAEFISEKLWMEYRGKGKEYLEKKRVRRQRAKKLNNLIVQLSKELSRKYESSTDYDQTLEAFLQSEFKPQIKAFCHAEQMKKCWPINGEWNNARFAEFNTYQEKVNELEELYKLKGLGLKAFFLFVKEKAENYNEDQEFIEYLKS